MRADEDGERRSELHSGGLDIDETKREDTEVKKEFALLWAGTIGPLSLSKTFHMRAGQPRLNRIYLLSGEAYVPCFAEEISPVVEFGSHSHNEGKAASIGERPKLLLS